MDYEQVGNSVSNSSSSEPSELAELDIEFAELVEEFDLEQDSSTDTTSELDAQIAGTELDPASGTEVGQSMSILDIADRVGTGAESDAEFFGAIGNWIRKKAAKLIRKLITIVRKAPKYAPCIPKVMTAVAAFKAKKWGTALRLAYSAYKCIKSK